MAGRQACCPSRSPPSFQRVATPCADSHLELFAWLSVSRFPSSGSGEQQVRFISIFLPKPSAGLWVCIHGLVFCWYGPHLQISCTFGAARRFTLQQQRGVPCRSPPLSTGAYGTTASCMVSIGGCLMLFVTSVSCCLWSAPASAEAKQLGNTAVSGDSAVEMDIAGAAFF